MWLAAHSKAGWVQLFDSVLYFINAHELLPGTLVNANERISLLWGSFCLLIKLILVEDVGNLALKGCRREEIFEFEAIFFTSIGKFLHPLLTTSL